MVVACDSARVLEGDRSGGAHVPAPGSRHDAAVRLANLLPLMERTPGTAEVAIGLVDGPVAMDHPELATESIHEVPGAGSAACGPASSASCAHGTAVAGILTGRRRSVAPGICPGCTLLVRPLFLETPTGGGLPSASPEQLATAILDCLHAGARVVNVSSAMVAPAFGGDQRVQEALDRAAALGVIVVAAAGNEATLGRSAVTGHPAVVPAVASYRNGRPMAYSNLGRSIGRSGLSAPGQEIVTLGPGGRRVRLSGTSAAAPFVTGTIALLWSVYPDATPVEVRAAVTGTGRGPRTSVVPPLLDAEAAWQALAWTRARPSEKGAS